MEPMVETPNTVPADNQVDDSLLPHLKKKYLIILILLGVIAVMIPSYVMGAALIVHYLFIVIIGLIIFGLYTDYRFQKHRIKWRPFIVAGISQKIAIARGVVVLITTLGLARQTGQRVPYLVLWLLIGAVILNHFQVFWMASQHKHKYPDRCEFC